MSRVSKLSVVCRLPEYSGLNLTDSDLVPVVDKSPSIVAVDELTSLVFAPDPLTGLPNSALGIMLSKDKNPEFAQFIQENLLKAVSTYAEVTTDADMALEGVKSRNESFDEYAKRLQYFCKVDD